MKKHEFLLPGRVLLLHFARGSGEGSGKLQHIYLCRSNCVNAIIRMHFAIILLLCRNISWHSQISPKVFGTSGGSSHFLQLHIHFLLIVLKNKNIPVTHQELFSKIGPEGPGGQEIECKYFKCDLCDHKFPSPFLSRGQVQGGSFSTYPEFFKASFPCFFGVIDQCCSEEHSYFYCSGVFLTLHTIMPFSWLLRE